MSSKTHNSDYFILVVLGLLSAGVLLLFITLGWIQDDARTGQWARTSQSTNVEGTRVCYTLYERLGIPTERLEQPSLEENLRGIGALFCLETPITFHGGEWLALRSWVRQGGVLVGPAYLKNVLVDSVTTDSTCCHLAPRTIPGPSVSVRQSELPAESQAQPLTCDVKKVFFNTSASLDPLENRIQPSEPRIDDSQQTPAPRVLFSDQVGPRIVEFPLDQGRLIVFADSSFLANGFIAKADNAILAVNLACYAQAHARSPRFAFDEYHMGFGRHQTGWDAFTYMLTHTSPGRAWLVASFAGILFLIYKGRRLGSRRPPPPSRRRSKTEYVHAVGSTYRVAGVRRLTLDLIFRAFVRQVVGQVGLPASASFPVIAEALARRCGGNARQYVALFDACAAASQGPPLPVRRFGILLNQLAQLENELTHGKSSK